MERTQRTALESAATGEEILNKLHDQAPPLNININRNCSSITQYSPCGSLLGVIDKAGDLNIYNANTNDLICKMQSRTFPEKMKLAKLGSASYVAGQNNIDPRFK